MNLFFPRFRQFIAQNRADALSIFALALLPFLFHWQEALRQAVFFFGDILLFFYPTHLAYATALRAGQLPLWEPRMLTGFPLFAEGQIAALYPTHPILYGLLPIDLATNYDILTSLAWVSVGMYLFLRVINLRPPSAFLGAVALGLGGFFTVRMQHMSVLTTASWLPWLFWCWEKHEQEADSRRRWRWWVVLAVFAGIQMLGGHPQFAFMSIVLLGLYATVNWQRNSVPQLALPMPFNRWLGPVLRFFQPQRAIPLVVAIVLGAAIAAVQLMPTFELSMYSNRAAGLLPKFFNAFSLRAVHYLMLFHPFILGNPYPRVSVEVIGYIGFLSVTFALAAPFVQRNRRVVFFLAMALVALFLGLGDQNAFYRGLRYLPLFNYFRVPSRFLFWYSFAAAVLAAITFDYLLARAKTTARFTRGQIITIALFAILIPAITGLVPTFPLDTWLSIWVWLPIVLACVTAWIVLCARHVLFTRTTLIALVIGLTLADLSLFAAVYAKTYDLSVPVDDFYKPPSSLAVIEGLKPEEGRVLTSLWIYPVMVTMRESLYPNVSLSHNIPNAIGYTPLIPQRTG